VKKVIIFLLTVSLLFCASSCAFLDGISSLFETTDKVFEVEGYDLQIKADSTFYKTDADNLDLQITNDDAYISILAYEYIDLPTDTTPLDVYYIQNEDLFNCMFCYCPLYTLGDKCGGNFNYLENDIKDCSNCMVPHKWDSYDYITSKFGELSELAKKNRDK